MSLDFKSIGKSQGIFYQLITIGRFVDVHEVGSYSPKPVAATIENLIGQSAARLEDRFCF